MIFAAVKFIKELFPIRCCTCKKKFKAKDMVNWYGLSYICNDCFNPKPKEKVKRKGIKTRKGVKK